jgi:predicted metal-dependent enzyme (double-stranded beta helix superfamily)
MSKALATFVREVTLALNQSLEEEFIVPIVKKEMKALVTDGSWLPDPFSLCASEGYRQYLLYCDPLERFSVVSFVWGPEQRTPVHDHTVWGVIGQMVGEEASQSFLKDETGKLVPVGPPDLLRRGEIAVVSPREIDVHYVSNPSSSAKAISIHAYGGNIGKIKRHTYNIDDGTRKEFISSYSNTVLPNIWL